MPHAENTTRTRVHRLRDLTNPPEFHRVSQWRHCPPVYHPERVTTTRTYPAVTVPAYWYRLDTGGTIWRLDLNPDGSTTLRYY